MARDQEVELLVLLKGTVEGLLTSQVPNVWSIYGGLNRLHLAMERIFKHGYRICTQNGEPDLWVFINGLSWLQPTLATSPSLVFESYRESSHVPAHIVNDMALLWIYKSLETHTLSQKLSWLLSDQEHLLSCYEKSAFLSQEKFGEAALICLRAIEHNQSSLLTEINPCLYLTKWNPKVLKTHRRCSSYPETLERNSLWMTSRAKSSNRAGIGIISTHSEEGQEIEADEISKETPKSSDIRVSFASHVVNADESEEAETESCSSQPKKDTQNICVDKVKAWSSLPNILNCSLSDGPRERSLTANIKPWLLSRNHSMRGSNPFGGSQTLPSTPYRSVKVVSSTPVKLTTTDKLLDMKDLCISPKLSPSVLQVDYASLQHSECSDISKPNRITPKKAVPAKIVSSKSNSSKTAPPKGQKSSSHSKYQTSKAAISDEVKSRSRTLDSPGALRPKLLDIPKSEETVIPLQMNCIEKCDKPTSVKSPMFNHLRRRRPGSSSSCDWTKESSLNHSGTPLSRKSFMEDGGNSVQPMSTGFFPRPVEGQSLLSFLSSGQFSRTNAELDRENAHFSISEAVIAAVEQIKCNSEIQTVPKQDVVEESDDEINHLYQRIRLRRHQLHEENKRLIWGVSLLSDGKTDTTTDQSISPLSTSPGTPSDSISTDGVEDIELDDTTNIAALTESGLSMSMASLYSEAELSKHTPPQITENVGHETLLSAESVALSLIRQFSEKQLPRASDLKWLISEQEVPQQLLPLPNSWPVSPDEPEDDMRQATPLRGNMEWAPPRPQVIFTPHPNPVRRTLLVKQNYRCGGCGMKVAPAYAHRFRYCEYLGRYFCTGCHSNQMAVIPGRVLSKWDFSRVPVCTFTYNLLDQMYMDPLFRVPDLSPGLYRKVRSLERCRKLRLQLYYLKDLLLNCRFAKGLQEVLKHEPNYMCSDIDVYSMMDFLQVKQGELPARLQELVALGNEHTIQCQLCLARGFLCELCSSKEVIFPWQVGRVTRCDSCGSCYHTRCRPRPPLPPCPRCKRISDRSKSQGSQDDNIVEASDAR